MRCESKRWLVIKMAMACDRLASSSFTHSLAPAEDDCLGSLEGDLVVPLANRLKNSSPMSTSLTSNQMTSDLLETRKRSA